MLFLCDTLYDKMELEFFIFRVVFIVFMSSHVPFIKFIHLLFFTNCVLGGFHSRFIWITHLRYSCTFIDNCSP